MAGMHWMARAVRPGVAVLALTPTALLLRDTVAGTLGANPVETLTHRTGLAAITLLMLSLAVTPLRAATGIGALIRLRRMLGLFAFWYAGLHVLVYVADRTWLTDVRPTPGAVLADVAKRPYVTVGLAAFLMLIPLAVTSTGAWAKRLGGRRWQRLHRLVYPAAAAAVLHFLWLVKADRARPVVYGAVLVSLLGARVVLSRLARARSQVAGGGLEGMGRA